MSSTRVVSWSHVCLGAVFAVLCSGAPGALIAQQPQAVSPGSAIAAQRLAGSCPTFSWSEAVGATGYELVLYQVGVDGVLRAVLEASAPAGASSWTPAADRCPEPGNRFAWAVRAVTVNGPGGWSEPLLFETPGAPTDDEVRQALETLRRYRAEREEPVGEGLVPARLPDDDPAGAGARPYPDEGRHAPDRFRDTDAALVEPTVNSTPSPKTVNTPPSFSLNLEGDVELGGFVFKNGTPFLHNDGGIFGDNTALGLNALANTTPGDPGFFSGRHNSALGSRAMKNNTSGRFNTAIGSGALYSNTTGFRNTANGVFALPYNTSGHNNTATGYRALFSNSTGAHNAAFGIDALDPTPKAPLTPPVATGHSPGTQAGTTIPPSATGHSSITLLDPSTLRSGMKRGELGPLATTTSQSAAGLLVTAMRAVLSTSAATTPRPRPSLRESAGQPASTPSTRAYALTPTTN